VQKQVRRAEEERRSTEDELARGRGDIVKLKEALTVATEAVRRAAGKRADLVVQRKGVLFVLMEDMILR